MVKLLNTVYKMYLATFNTEPQYVTVYHGPPWLYRQMASEPSNSYTNFWKLNYSLELKNKKKKKEWEGGEGEKM